MINESAYQAWIGFKGKKYYLGTYPTLNEAIKARQRGEQLHLDFLEEYYRERSEDSEAGKKVMKRMVNDG